jgi:hypothetical protein
VIWSRRACRYLVLSDSLRYSARAALTDAPAPAAQHPISPSVSVVTVPLQDGLQVVIPLFCERPDDEPFARTVVMAITDDVASKKHLPTYKFWEAEVRNDLSCLLLQHL